MTFRELLEIAGGAELLAVVAVLAAWVAGLRRRPARLGLEPGRRAARERAREAA